MAEPWWDIEIAYYVNKLGVDPEKARTVVILQWLWHGDLRPLEAAIAEGHELDQGVLNLLADMISGSAREGGKPPPYRLKAVPLRPGRKKARENGIRNLVAALAYEDERISSGSASDEVFDRIAKAIGTSHQTVRKAVTAFHKAHGAK
jgi:hypothetical protein